MRVGADALDASGLNIAGNPKVACVGFAAHRLQLGDGDVVALAVFGPGKGKPAHDSQDDDGGDDNVAHSLTLHGYG